MDIYDRIDAILQERHMSRRQLAIAAGISENTISGAFRRRSGLKVETIQKIAAVLNVNTLDLIGDAARIEHTTPFCINLRTVREARTMTQQLLADALGVSRSAVSMWESGEREPNIPMLIRLSKLFAITVDELIGAE